jgi:pyruvate/2-oxoglutarate dehydrogenase complex dihydrolipoamide acyltransferase (E2) component
MLHAMLALSMMAAALPQSPAALPQSPAASPQSPPSGAGAGAGHDGRIRQQDVEELLNLDDYLLTISRKLSEIDRAYDYIDTEYTGENPYPWEKHPNRPTLRDRRRALRAARAAIARTMTETWVN